MHPDALRASRTPVSGAIDPKLLDLPVSGLNLIPGTLRDQLSGGSTLLVLLRRFG